MVELKVDDKNLKILIVKISLALFLYLLLVWACISLFLPGVYAPFSSPLLLCEPLCLLVFLACVPSFCCSLCVVLQLDWPLSRFCKFGQLQKQPLCFRIFYQSLGIFGTISQKCLWRGVCVCWLFSGCNVSNTLSFVLFCFLLVAQVLGQVYIRPNSLYFLFCSSVSTSLRHFNVYGGLLFEL